MRAGRLVSLLLLLQERGRMTAERIAAELGVSVRTVYRDVESLSAAGVPVYGEPGHDGGYRLLDGYRTRLNGLTEAEAEVLFLAGIPDAATGLGLEAELAAIQLKLSAALSPGHRDLAERTRQRFHLDAAGWFQRPEPVPCLRAAASAVAQQRRLKAKYRAWYREPAARDLCPLGLVLKGGRWYLVASASPEGRPRTYKVSSLSEAELSEETFERPEDFDLAEWWSAAQADWDARRFRSTAVVRCSPEAVARAADNLEYRVAEAIAAGERDEDSWVTATIPIESEGHAAGQLLLLSGVEVVEPDSLRALMRERATEAAELNS